MLAVAINVSGHIAFLFLTDSDRLLRSLKFITSKASIFLQGHQGVCSRGHVGISPLGEGRHLLGKRAAIPD